MLENYQYCIIMIHAIKSVIDMRSALRAVLNQFPLDILLSIRL